MKYFYLAVSLISTGFALLFCLGSLWDMLSGNYSLAALWLVCFIASVSIALWSMTQFEERVKIK